jgi:hypothetical protein
MDKKYVILTNTIFDIGGAQIYTRNKYVYLKEKGWNIFIFSICHGDTIILKELKRFESSIIRKLHYPPCIFSKRSQKKTINDMIEMLKLSLKLGEQDKIIIESHIISLSLWGELLSEKLKCKHLIYLLQESFSNLNISTMKFFDFKHKRRELAGITSKSLELLFKNYKSINSNENYWLKAACTNVVEDVHDPIIENIAKLDINIGCISRLQKAFIKTMIKEVVIFAKKNKDKNILLLLIGDAPDKITKKMIIYITKFSENIKLIFTGRMYPLPKKLFELIDIFIGNAGSARVSASEGALTLTVDVINHKPIGLLGYNTNDVLYSEYDTKSDLSISSMLEDIFINKKFQIKDKNNNYNNGLKNFMKEYDKHLSFLNSSVGEKEYCNVMRIKSINKKNTVKKILIRTLGITVYEKLVINFIKKRLSYLKI